jgi:tetratricopeptide (TPR) repeat protein
MRRKILIKALFIIIFSLAISCHAQEGQSNLERIFYRGNDAYEKGEYSKAIDEYEGIIAAGYESGPVYYNLGNAYFKTGDLGKAVLDYERARRLMPRSADLKANIQFAANRISGETRLAEKGVWQWRPVRLYAGNFTINELLLVVSGIYTFAFMLLILAMYFPARKVRIFIAIFFLFIFGLYNSLIIWHKADGVGKDAVVMQDEADSRYGPFDSATTFFKLHEGMKVKILKDKAGWYKIERPDGKVGWVKKSDLEII